MYLKLVQMKRRLNICSESLIGSRSGQDAYNHRRETRRNCARYRRRNYPPGEGGGAADWPHGAIEVWGARPSSCRNMDSCMAGDSIKSTNSYSTKVGHDKDGTDGRITCLLRLLLQGERPVCPAFPPLT
jgi:hypothetical protein